MCVAYNILKEQIFITFYQFQPDINFWLQSENTYRVIFIQVFIQSHQSNLFFFNEYLQSQSSWFVITGSDFVVDAHGVGGIQGNGQVCFQKIINEL